MSPECMPHDLLCSYIIPEVITSHLHDVLIDNDQTQDVRSSAHWNAFQVIPLVCGASYVSTQCIYKKIFGVEGEDSLCEAIRPIYSQARSLWKIAKDADENPDTIPDFKYRGLISRKSLIQIYICLAISRRFFNADILRPLACRCRTTTTHSAIELLQLCHNDASFERGMVSWAHGTELPSLATNCDSPCKIQDGRMHRLYLPLTCASMLCDTIRPETLAYRVAEYIAGLTPWYTTVPMLLNYIQDIDAFLAKEYRVSEDVYHRWIIQSLDLINRIDDTMQKFQNQGRLTSSFAKVSVVPKGIYEVVGLRRSIERILQSIQIRNGNANGGLNHDDRDPDDGDPNSMLTNEIHKRARAILAKLD